MKKLLLLGIVLLLAASVMAVPSGLFPKAQAYFDRIAADDPVVMVISNPDILFTQTGLTLNTEITRAKITVQAMPDCPENAPYQTNTLQCFYISSDKIDDEHIKMGFIKFKVPKYWIEANGYDSNKVQLKRYNYAWNDGGKLSEWKKQPTTFDNEDSDYAYYTTTTDGLYYFSITAEKARPVVLQRSEPIVGQVVREPAPETYKYSLGSGSGKILDKNLLTLLAMVLVAIVLFTLQYSEHLTKPEPSAAEKTLSDLTEEVKFMLGHGYPPALIREELKAKNMPDWIIDYAFVEARKGLNKPLRP